MSSQLQEDTPTTMHVPTYPEQSVAHGEDSLDHTIHVTGGGLLGGYMMGVTSVFKARYPSLFRRCRVGGCSAGSIVAMCLLSSLSPDALHYRLVDFASTFRWNRLPEDLYKSLCNLPDVDMGRGYVSVTRIVGRTPFLRNEVLTHFSSQEDMSDAVVASALVPVLTGRMFHRHNGGFYMDGAVTDRARPHEQECLDVCEMVDPPSVLVHPGMYGREFTISDAVDPSLLARLFEMGEEDARKDMSPFLPLLRRDR